jgi:putative lipoic acid-binding regulatory protein
MESIPHDELLGAHHQFPGTYQIKAIGSNDDDFAGRVVAAALSELSGPSELEHSIRQTQGGRHMAVTLQLNVQSAEQVLAIYAALKQVEGLALLL